MMVIAEVQGDPLYQPIAYTGVQVPLDDARLLAPVIPRSKVVGIGKNYADHVAEMGGGETPTEPLMFLKPNTSVIGPGDPIVLPRQSANVHYEGELAVVIGRICKDVPKERVGEVVFGFTCVFSAMRALTIFLTRAAGSGWSTVNCSVPFDVSQGAISSASAAVTLLLIGKKLQCFLKAA